MAGFYVPSNFSANYVANKKNEDGTYTYDSEVNRAGIDAQRNLQQLNKQYGVTINQASAQGLLANRGLRASALGTGYKSSFAQQLQDQVSQEVDQATLSVGEVKQNIFQSLGQNLNQIGQVQVQEINNMRRTASSLEQYHNYAKTLYNEEGNYTDKFGFKTGDEYTFEDNYDKLFDQQINNKGILSLYLDESGNQGLSYEEWLRQNSGSSESDTSWLDWVYNGGLTQYQDFIKNGVK